MKSYLQLKQNLEICPKIFDDQSLFLGGTWRFVNYQLPVKVSEWQVLSRNEKGAVPFSNKQQIFGEDKTKANSAGFGMKSSRGHTLHCLDDGQESDHICTASFIQIKASKVFYT